MYTSSGTNWEVIILESANKVLEFTKRPGSVDVFMVSAGNNGASGNQGNWTQDFLEGTGNGGSGGEIFNSLGDTLEQGRYNVVVGTAIDGADHDTSITDEGGSAPRWKAYQANGSNAGGTHSSINGSEGRLAFSATTDDGVLNGTYHGRKYAAGGGQGGVYYRNGSTTNYGAGGITGGGVGGSANSTTSNPGASATANTGSGGGGGGSRYSGNGYYGQDGGSGGSGIIIIRNHRTAS